MENRVDVKILCGKDLIAMDFSGTNDFGLNNTFIGYFTFVHPIVRFKICHSSRQLVMAVVANIVKLQSSLTVQSKSVRFCFTPVTTKNN